MITSSNLKLNVFDDVVIFLLMLIYSLNTNNYVEKKDLFNFYSNIYDMTLK